ncbi:NAD-dependent malic enzyme [archaeon]|nr:NAD-dependent malic enzyme [archaeon]
MDEKKQTIYEKALDAHKKTKGKIAILAKMPAKTSEDLSIAYTPGVAEPCRQIYKNKESVYDYTSKGNLIAVVSDGSAVLGLGNIGPKAAMPVMEGKAILFKEFGDIDAFPICLDTQNTDEIIKTIKNIAPTFGGINLEDISAPRCFEIEKKLKEELDIPVFHDDQHGTAIVVLAAIINALKVVKKDKNDVSVVISGAGAAGMAIAKIIHTYGVKDIIICDTKGAIYNGRKENMNAYKIEIAKQTNKENKTGNLEDVIVGADIFIGVSKPKVMTENMVSSMNKDAIVLAMSNPEPEIMPDLAKNAGAKIVGTGRSDFPNQVNNVLAFPGIFRGALDVRASDITKEMNLAAANAIASLIDDEKLSKDNILPLATDFKVAKKVASAVSNAAIACGVARITKQ